MALACEISGGRVRAPVQQVLLCAQRASTHCATVILASVPHRAFDVVRVEKEMTGRLEQVAIPFWSQDDLEGIAHRGSSREP